MQSAHAVMVDAQVAGTIDLDALSVIAGQIGAGVARREGAVPSVSFSMVVADPDPLDAAARVLSRLGGLLARTGCALDRVLRVEVVAGEDLAEPVATSLCAVRDLNPEPAD